MSKFEIELLSKNGTSVIGVANDAESALSYAAVPHRSYSNPVRGHGLC
jgi:hypothetical protein